jgi:hypothetical protein
MATSQQVLVPDALESNQAGRLTDVQRKNLGARSRGTRKAELQFAAIFTILGLLVWFAAGPAKYAMVKPLIGIAFLVLAGALLVRAFLGADSVTQDVRSGRVESVEGAIAKWKVESSSRGTSLTSYHVQVGEARVQTSLAFYQSVPDAGIVRLYYLPHSHRLVNLERLADRPLPPDALTDPRRAVHDVLQAAKGGLLGDPVKEAEARAELEAIGNAIKPRAADSATPPPNAERDPRALAQAILGTWRSGAMTVVFGGDGTVVATMPGGMRLSGQWSVDASGKLVSDVAGNSEPADAWVVGDNLTLNLAAMGRGLSFVKVPS